MSTTASHNTTLDTAIEAAVAAAPTLNRDALTAAVTAALTSVLGENRALQVAVRTATEQAATERDVLTGAQLWFQQNGHGLDELGSILGGHVTYGFAPDGDTEGLNPVQVAEAATEAYLREFARANRAEHKVELLIAAA